MRIQVITSLHKLAQLRPEWEAAYDADEQAQFFLSWSWMFRRLQSLDAASDIRPAWLLLVARAEDDTSVGFLPLSLRRILQGSRSRLELRTAGSPVADYTGFICRPDHETRALAGLADGLKMLAGRLHWDDLSLANVCESGERLKLFLSHFSFPDFKLLRLCASSDGVDNSVCPYVALPTSWESYLSETLSSNMRQKVRRYLRQVEGSPEYRIVHATPSTVERDIRALLNLWESKWGARKQGAVDAIRKKTFSMLTQCFDDGTLFLPSLWRNETPVGALAILVDPRKRTYFFAMAGRDASVASPPPGLCLHAFSIRHAIQRGYRSYDFLRGDESYKFLFGATRRPITTIIVRAQAEQHSDAAVPRWSAAQAAV